MNRWLAMTMGVWMMGGCVGSEPGPRHPMTEGGITENEKAAKEHELEAAKHRQNARAQLEAPCPNAAVCWTGIVNPAAASEYELADKQLRLAADHRARVRELREAETKACSAVAEYDRAVSPFAHYRDIRSVEPITEGGAKGIAVTFKSIRGLTIPTLRQIVDCHLARNTALGHDVPEMVDCPLVPRVKATVLQGEAGVVVRIVAEDDAAALTLQRCSRTMNAGMGPAT